MDKDQYCEELDAAYERYFGETRIYQYQCRSCKAMFDEPELGDAEAESYEYWGQTGVRYTYAEVCPDCGSEDFDDLFRLQEEE